MGFSSDGPAGAGPFNGTYNQGGSDVGAQVRRARIIMNGGITDNTSYKMQLDVAGPVKSGTGVTANSQINVLEAYGQYTFGNGTPTNPAIAAGEFANPFGSILPASPAAWLTPERPLAFSESNNVGMWDSEDYDKGVRFVYAPNNFRFVYALVNGDGRQSENTDGHLDDVLHLGYSSDDKQFTVGASYYDGYVDRSPPVAGETSFPEPKKQLGGLDAEVNLKDGTFVQGEYVGGTYEKRAYYNTTLTPSTSNPIGADTLQVDPYVQGNKAHGYYIWGGHTWNQTSNRPLTLGLDYDVFDRSTGSDNSSANYYSTSSPTKAGTYYSSGSTFDDVNFGGGVMYNLDKATRLRFWYETPTAVSHAPGTPQPPRYGLYTAEMLVKF